MFVLIPVCANLREPDIHSFFDPRPETSIVEPDAARVLFRLDKKLLNLQDERCLFGFQELLIHFLFGAGELELKFVDALLRDSMKSIHSIFGSANANTK